MVLITDNDEWYADYQLLVENLGRAKPDVLVMDYQYVLERKNFVSNLRRFLHVFLWHDQKIFVAIIDMRFSRNNKNYRETRYRLCSSISSQSIFFLLNSM